ncbi:MAG: hypothetical protein ACR2NL_04165 [Acidimicrobiia bacterium]
MQYIFRYHIHPGRSEEFVAWLGDNEATMAQHTPDGWSYVGTWFTVRGFGSYAAESRWDIANYAALDVGWGDEVHLGLLQDFMAFTDQSRPSEAALMKSTSQVITLPGT